MLLRDWVEREPIAPRGTVLFEVMRLRYRRNIRYSADTFPLRDSEIQITRLGWSAGRGPLRSQRNLRSASLIGRSSMLAEILAFSGLLVGE